MSQSPSSVATRSQRLKAATHAVHDTLDKSIMAADIFANREQFGRFLRVQYRFHRDIEALYAQPAVAALVPELAQRCRLPEIAADLRDLQQPQPAAEPARLGADTPLPTALGWLYVAEGSNLGGTILFKIASEKLGLGRDFGARHLAAHPDGAARHWRAFTAALDAAPLSPEEESQMMQAAQEAFATVQAYAREELAPPALA
ncbi:biliverdin-producing heme oxygenase [Vandammella animalimorsus]|uniref:Biliverdin-producing heme oxygenase n=1 Tax=Vandammella animalimorsus TaxID=2029117 RepID=A0A2A2AFP6_9BURK|nr:biliverdin-producing heme oxygenase [Vandammella animalimorsus]PAT36593.1 biliverdin-producing heme oxygenase [Vandammella animalimorsus]